MRAGSVSAETQQTPSMYSDIGCGAHHCGAPSALGRRRRWWWLWRCGCREGVGWSGLGWCVQRQQLGRTRGCHERGVLRAIEGAMMGGGVRWCEGGLGHQDLGGSGAPRRRGWRGAVVARRQRRGEEQSKQNDHRSHDEHQSRRDTCQGRGAQLGVFFWVGHEGFFFVLGKIRFLFWQSFRQFFFMCGERAILG